MRSGPKAALWLVGGVVGFVAYIAATLFAPWPVGLVIAFSPVLFCLYMAWRALRDYFDLTA